ncbi:phage tail protein [Paucibacter sp. M5-1]|uniref:phage tail protein n=1 Tax=Paucibacter sp. M5-1 TaxID=3015998 RepID=UPI0022B90384|nr:phage tail protein [Paucibacter sp. M5-1]MCZ7884690.1 phage tail protein [Paucibacter sp. M5-1]
MSKQQTPWFGSRFHVAFTREPIAARGGGSGEGLAEDLCEGGFAEVSGLEASMEAKTIREGGANYGVHQRAGQVSFATVVIKRGMAPARDLWHWWALFAGAGAPDGANDSRRNGAFAHRLTVRICMLDIDGTPLLKWRLERAMPVKFKAAELSARAAEIGIEEIHLAHEGLYFEAP